MVSYVTKFAVVAAVAQAQAADNCGGVAERPPTAELQIISYNDVYEMKPYDDGNGILVGGPSHVVPLAKTLRKNYENNLVLFAGDTMSPSLWSAYFKGMHMIDAHNAIGVDYACLGNHEFDFGIDGFLNVSAKSTFPWLNANTYELSSKKLLRGTIPNAVKSFKSATMGEFKVGFFGVMYDMQDDSKGLYWTDPIVAAKEQVAYLRNTEKVDFVIALTHQFLDDDNKFSQEVQGVNMIYGDHDHSAMYQTQFGTPYLKSDLDMRNVWFSHLKWYAAKNATNSTAATPAFTKMTHKNFPITQALPTDAALDALIAQYDAQIKELNKRVVGSLCQITDFTKLTLRYKEAPIANFISDAFVSFYSARVPVDASVVNGGGIRTDRMWPAGPISIGDLISWSPFGNMILVIKTDGASLKKFINSQMVASCGTNFIAENGIYVHSAGFKYVFVCNGKTSGAVTDIAWIGNRSGPVLDTDVFNFAIQDFMYDLFKKAGGVTTKMIVPVAEAARIEATIEAYIKLQMNQSVCPALEGRTLVKFA
ncbi:hypothetical protein DYB32_000476 [Aphanomyces invadans]|uniref:5'-Nucleotidase C-terminal domain-containing protein n=1 Tax=Aphanomyces invadans TaxID=157072 RepID=A0A3R6WTY5_9STRA|nr:hypothetical protein DYB32_000476 [Aphanomyces invadans]